MDRDRQDFGLAAYGMNPYRQPTENPVYPRGKLTYCVPNLPCSMAALKSARAVSNWLRAALRASEP